MATERSPVNKSAIPADRITLPGCYVCHWSGHLMRITVGMSGHIGGAMVSIVGDCDGDLMVTRLSPDPFIPLSQARTLAATVLHGGTARRTSTPTRDRRTRTAGRKRATAKARPKKAAARRAAGKNKTGRKTTRAKRGRQAA